MNEPTRDPLHSRAQLQQAEEALSRGDVSGALGFLEAASRLDPDDDELPLLAATLQLRQGEPLKAAHLATDAARLRPLHPRALDVLAVACIDALQPELARRILRHAIAQAPGLENLKSNLRDAKRRARELKQAGIPKEEIQRASQLLPHRAINELLADREATLESLVFVTDDAQLPLLDGALDSLDGVGARIRIADVRPEPAAALADREDGVEILRGVGAETERRNQALKKVRADWILILEASERLTTVAREGIEEALADGSCIGHALEVRRGELEARLALRLVRNGSELRFQGRLDPQVTPSLVRMETAWGLAIGDGAIGAIETVPWDGEQSLRRGDESLAALVERDAADPANERAAVERAVLDLAGGRAAQALDVFRRVRGEITAHPARCRALELEEPTVLEGYALLRLDRHDELARLIDDYHARFPETVNTAFLAGAAARGLRRAAQAVEWFEQAFDLQGAAAFSPVLPEIHGAMLPNMLGTSLLDAGRSEHAREAFELALARDPDNLEAQLGQIALRYTEGKIEEIIHDLDRLVDSHGDDAKVWLTGGIVLGQYPKLAPATLGWLEEACQRFPDDGDMLLRLADAQLRSGRIEEALANYDRIAGREGHTAAARAAAALASESGPPPIPDESRSGIADDVLRWFQLWMAYGAYETLDRALLNLQRDPAAWPDLAPRAADWLERIGQSEAATGLRPPGDSPCRTGR